MIKGAEGLKVKYQQPSYCYICTMNGKKKRYSERGVIITDGQRTAFRAGTEVMI